MNVFRLDVDAVTSSRIALLASVEALAATCEQLGDINPIGQSEIYRDQAVAFSSAWDAFVGDLSCWSRHFEELLEYVGAARTSASDADLSAARALRGLA